MNITDISGKPMVRLGGEFVHAHHVAHGIVSEFTWDEDGNPILILYRALPQTKVGAFVLELKDAHRVARPDGYATHELLLLAKVAHEAMGYHMDKSAVMRIIDAILDGIPQLVAMPPEPGEKAKRRQAQQVGEGTLRIELNGKRFEVQA